MDDFTLRFKAGIHTSTDKLREELKGIRTGRAHTGMVEGMIVEAYGGSMKMKLLELASITTEGNDGIVIMPFDPSTSQDIEKAILTSPLGLMPKIEGSKMTIRIPPLSEEQRLKYVKLVAQMIEETKNTIRRQRENVRKDIKQQFDAKDLTEDDKFRLEKDIDSQISDSNMELQSIKEKKEQEIMAV
ncbi:ribosome-recycling factor [Candidatus Woesebacteria bacterium]|nr:ribosome-recycling factor [Candidatus Woesebacteria bacterium]